MLYRDYANRSIRKVNHNYIFTECTTNGIIKIHRKLITYNTILFLLTKDTKNNDTP